MKKVYLKFYSQYDVGEKNKLKKKNHKSKLFIYLSFFFIWEWTKQISIGIVQVIFTITIFVIR